MANRLSEDLPANLSAAEAAGITMPAIRTFMESRGIPRMLRAIDDSGQRMSEIVDNMLSFARQADSQASSYDVADLLDKTVELAATDYDLKKQYDFRAIQIQREYGDDLPFVPCEGGKIQQVFLNILRNGAQAMQQAGTEKPNFILRTFYEENRGMVRVEIEDNGPGMSEAHRKRAFEPFFTTKSVGEGTGLGLSVSYFIITANHGGEMDVLSEPGEGAKFIIRLPLERSIE
jgi:signal transduction histidine kinase